MFSGARVFNQDISRWDVSNVRSISAIFARGRQFNQDIGRWDVSGLTDDSGLSSAFEGANAFRQNLCWNLETFELKAGITLELDHGGSISGGPRYSEFNKRRKCTFCACSCPPSKPLLFAFGQYGACSAPSNDTEIHAV